MQPIIPLIGPYFACFPEPIKQTKNNIAAKIFRNKMVPCVA